MSMIPVRAWLAMVGAVAYVGLMFATLIGLAGYVPDGPFAYFLLVPYMLVSLLAAVVATLAIADDF